MPLTQEQIDEAAAYVPTGDGEQDADARPLSAFSRDELMYLLMVFHQQLKEANRASHFQLWRYGGIEQLHELLGILRYQSSREPEKLKEFVSALSDLRKGYQ